MEKRKSTEINFNPKKKKIIDIEFDSDPDCEEDPEWLPENCDLISESVASEDSSSESEDFEESEDSVNHP